MDVKQTLSIRDVDAMVTAPRRRFEIERRSIAGVPTLMWRHARRDLLEVLRRRAQHGSRPTSSTTVGGSRCPST
jgi:hypothetical protein